MGIVYKFVSLLHVGGVRRLSGLNSAQNWVIRILEDPITKILLENSHLTKIQLETLLIDILSEEIAKKRLKYDEKVKLRLKKDEISRGAFNRTLNQARKNVIRTIYTILLLGYIGFLETPKIEGYVEVANRLHSYTEAYREIWERVRSGKACDEDLKVVKLLKDELDEVLRSLAEPKSLSKRM